MPIKLWEPVENHPGIPNAFGKNVEQHWSAFSAITSKKSA
jgi:hypothetical protein